MFLKPHGDHVLAFRDKFEVNLDENLFGKYEFASAVIDKVFALEEVLIADPATAALGCPVRARWITIKLQSKPINNEEDVEKLETKIMTIDGIVSARGIFELPAKTQEIIEHLYGGKRSKL